jgi:hypothetical protein
MLIKWIIQQEAVKVQSTILRNRVSIDPPLNAWVVVGASSLAGNESEERHKHYR